MFQINDLNERWEKLVKWRGTEEYQSLCRHKQQECQRLSEIGHHYLQTRLTQTDQSIARSECATGGNIHRSFYCPSPIYEVIIGNVKRGRILKRVTAASNITHRFDFDEKDNLQSCISFANGMEISREFIFSLNEMRYGITVNEAEEISAVSEEIYHENRLQKYTYAEFALVGVENSCFHLHTETFGYDEIGLKSSTWEEYEPLTNIYNNQYYDFEREDGYLSSYRVIERKGLQTEYSNPINYRILKKVKA